MLEIEIDGKTVEVPDGSTVMDAANKAGVYVPHFCYHKKLSIAASCRMCLVDVEKAPKAVPACATPVTAGMKVSTHSEKATKAQRSVMEFLLINHPLDCPICDQGGECQLQDLAVGYGKPESRYQEEKRVVFNKNLGPLIATDMTRCIHCTRCVRFGQEIAGIMELGMAGRGEHSEITAFVGRTVDSELSGNMIDLCPVGALTSKPFRFSARTWELARRRSVSPHDSLGANIVVQLKHDEVKRVLPLENEEVNECWLSDKDRFSYEGLYAEDRLTSPKLKHGGQWHTVDWQTALEYVAKTLRGVIADHGADAVGVLVSPHATLEEMFLAQKLVRGLGSDNVDFRLRQSDFSLDGKRAGAPWLGMPVAALSGLDSALVIGSFLRKDHPLVAQRLRQAVKHGGKLARIHACRDDLLMPLAADAIVAPSEFARVLAEAVKAAAENANAAVSSNVTDAVLNVNVTDVGRAFVATLTHGEKRAVLLGNLATQHPDYASIHMLAQELARLTGATLGVIGEAANTVGGYLAGAVPTTGKNAREMFAVPLKAYILLGNEPILDAADGAQVRAALAQAATVIHLGSFAGEAPDYADAMLPIAPFTETSGTFVNTEGRAQSFSAVARSVGETRPAWKVLRVLGNLLELPGFDYESSEDIRAQALPADIAGALNNEMKGVAARLAATPSTLQRVADVPIYWTDPLVRRAAPLQKTRDAASPVLRASGRTLGALGVTDGKVAVRTANGSVTLDVVVDDAVADGCARIPAAHPMTADLGALFAELIVERV